MEIDKILEKAHENLMKMSRTANGIVDVSASRTKKDVMAVSDGKQASEYAGRNFDNAIRYCFDNKDRIFSNPSDVRKFVEKVGAMINQDIVKDGSLIRSGEDSDKYNYTRIADLEDELQWFYLGLFERFGKKEDYDPVECAAFMEYYLNLRIHIFADGCSKTCMALSAYCMLRGNRLPVNYVSRDEYYEYGTRSVERCGNDTDQKAYERFYNYFKTLAK